MVTSAVWGQPGIEPRFRLEPESYTIVPSFMGLQIIYYCYVQAVQDESRETSPGHNNFAEIMKHLSKEQDTFAVKNQCQLIESSVFILGSNSELYSSFGRIHVSFLQDEHVS